MPWAISAGPAMLSSASAATVANPSWISRFCGRNDRRSVNCELSFSAVSIALAGGTGGVSRTGGNFAIRATVAGSGANPKAPPPPPVGRAPGPPRARADVPPGGVLLNRGIGASAPAPVAAFTRTAWVAARAIRRSASALTTPRATAEASASSVAVASSISARYGSHRSINSACEPSSMIRPWSNTTTRLASAMVDGRLAMRTVVRSKAPARRASNTAASVRISSALVASSRISTLGFARRARARQTRCRWPPDRLRPCSPTTVSKPWGNASMNPRAWAAAAASRT